MGAQCSTPPRESSEKLHGTKDVAVVGGGLAGLISGYYLALGGKKVHVFERQEKVGAETAYGPAGVTMWKPVKRGLKVAGAVDLCAGGPSGFGTYSEAAAWQLLDPDPRRPELMLQARKACHDFLAKHPDASPIIHTEGLMYVLDESYYKENLEFFKDDKTMVFLTKAEFESSEWYSRMFNGCNYYGVLLSKEEGAIDPHRFCGFLAKKIEKMGGKIHTSASVARLQETENGVFVHTDRPGAAEQRFDACVVTTGAASHPGSLLQASNIPDSVSEIYGVKGYTVTGRMPPGFLKMGFVDATDTKFIRPWTDKNGNYCIRAGGVADPVDPADPMKIKWERLEEFSSNQFIKKVFDANPVSGNTPHTQFDTMYDAAVDEGKIEVWTGVRPVNKHGRTPIIRWAKSSTRTLIVSGFGSNGYVMCWHAGPKVLELMP